MQLDSENSETLPRGRPKDLEKKDSIVCAAARQFLKEGFDRTSMDSIAKEAGVSKITVYNHFENKEQLFSAVISHKCETLGPKKDIEKLIGISDPREALLKIGASFAELLCNPDVIAMHRLIMNEAERRPQITQLFFESGPRPTIKAVEELLRYFNDSGKLKVDKPFEAARFFLAMCKLPIEFHVHMNVEPKLSESQLQAHLEEVVEVFLRAYRL